MRPLLESEIERLIAVLDLLDGDPDLEDTFDQEQVSEDEGAQCEDEGAIDCDREGSSDGFPNYLGPCGPVSMMLGHL